MPTAVAAARQSYADHPMVRLETAPPGPCHAVSLQETLSGTFTACATVILVEEGLEAAINDRPWPGRERKLDGRQEAHLIAFACSAAPEGHTHWTLQLLADKVVELEFAESISLETVRQILKKTNSSPGRRKSGVSPR